MVLVAATTENPSFSVISPLLSRSLLLTLRPLDSDAIEGLIRRALADERGLAGRFSITEEAVAGLVRLAGSDARKSLTLLEAAAGVASDDGSGEITVASVEAAANQASFDGVRISTTMWPARSSSRCAALTWTLPFTTWLA